MLFANVSAHAKPLKDAAWQLEQQSVKLKGSPCLNDRQEKLTALMAQSNLESVDVGASHAQTVIQVESLSLWADHYET